MWILAEIQSAVPPGVLYTAAMGLCGVVGILFQQIMAHHKGAVAEWQAERAEWRKERAELIDANRELAAVVDRNNKCTAQLMMSMFFLPADFKKTAEQMKQQIEEAEKLHDR